MFRSIIDWFRALTDVRRARAEATYWRLESAKERERRILAEDYAADRLNTIMVLREELNERERGELSRWLNLPKLRLIRGGGDA